MGGCQILQNALGVPVAQQLSLVGSMAGLGNIFDF
jgi:hypothetical protein